MRNGNWAVVVAMVSVLAGGCWTTVRHAETGANLMDVRVPTEKKSVRLVVANFHQLEIQDFDHESKIVGNLIVERWREAPGIHDISPHVAHGLADAGFTASYQPGDTGDYYVQGYVSRFERSHVGGRAVWAGLGSLLTPLGLCIIPLYFESPDYQALVVFSVFDGNGNKIGSAREPVRFTKHSTCPWGTLGEPAHELVGQAAGRVIALYVARAPHAPSLGPPGAPADATGPPPSSSSSTPASDTSPAKGDVELRLKKLEQLRASGAITEDEYVRKRKEIVDAL